MDIQELIRKRGSFLMAAKKIIDTAVSEKRDISSSEEIELSTLKGNVDTLAELINAQEVYTLLPLWRDAGLDAVLEHGCGYEYRSDYWEKRLAGSKTNKAGITEGKSKYPRITFIDNTGREHRGVNADERLVDVYPARFQDNFCSKKIGPGSFGKMLRAHILGDASELSDIERRVMGEGIGSVGGWFVPAGVSSFVIDAARNKAACVQAGAITLPIESPEMTFVKVVSDPTAYWRAENGAITESDGTLEPVNIKTAVVGALVRCSLELLEDSPQASTTIEDMLSSAIALELDRAALFGSGAGEPKGLFNCKNINSYSMGTDGAAMSSYDPFSYACEYVFDNNGEPGAVVMAPRTWGEIDRLKEGTTNAPLQPPASFAELKRFVTNQVPINQVWGTADTCSCAFVGDFTKILFAVRQNFTIDVSREASDVFSKMQVLIRAYMRADVAILRENHFTVIKGIK